MVTKILFNESGATGVSAYNASNEGLRARAYLALFREFDSAEFYSCGDLTGAEKTFLKHARLGDAGAAYELLKYRKDSHAEYEDRWMFVDVKLP